MVLPTHVCMCAICNCNNPLQQGSPNYCPRAKSANVILSGPTTALDVTIIVLLFILRLRTDVKKMLLLCSFWFWLVVAIYISCYCLFFFSDLHISFRCCFLFSKETEYLQKRLHLRG